MPVVDYTDAIDQQWRIFPLHGIIETSNGKACGCGEPECKAIGKHPRIDGWQNVQLYDEDQLAYLEDFDGMFFGNQLLDHYGIVVSTSGLLVVDVDGRNGGFESAEKLKHIREQCEFIVKTGSGSGEHWYFKSDGEVSLRTKLTDYPGIDFKSTGFVVGCGSLHASGYRYEVIKGKPENVTAAPSELLSLLERPERHSFTVEGESFEIEELRNMLKYVKHDAEQSYDRWLAVGMALHHSTDGAPEGEQLWEEWANAQGRTDNETINHKWHSFGKSEELITAGSLLTWARENGYTKPVTFEDNTDWGEIEAPATVEAATATAAQDDDYELGGLVGEVYKWIDSRCLFPRKHLALAAALQVVGNAAGLRYRVDPVYRTTLNLMTFAVADSGSGKEAVYQSAIDLMAAADLAPAAHGAIKSEQELVRNAVRHQASFYLIDEFGAMLAKIGSAKKRGNASYLEAVPAEIMKIFTKADSSYLVSGDMRQEISERIDRQIARVNKKIEDGRGTDRDDVELKHLQDDRSKMDSGISKPLLSFFGITEPNSFDAAIRLDPDMLVNGFLGRALLFRETEALPLRRDDYAPLPLPETIKGRLSQLYKDGHANIEGEPRVQLQGDEIIIRVSDDAKNELDNVYKYWRSRGLELEHEGQGLHTITTRVWEMVIKLAGILSFEVCTETVPTVQLHHVRSAHAIVRRVTDFKISHCVTILGADSNDDDERSAGLIEGVTAVVSSYPDGIGAGVIRNRNKKYGAANVSNCIKWMVGQGRLEEIVYRDSRNREQTKYKIK